MKKLLLAILLFAGIGISNALAQQQEAYYVNCWKCNGLTLQRHVLLVTGKEAVNVFLIEIVVLAKALDT